MGDIHILRTLAGWQRGELDFEMLLQSGEFRRWEDGLIVYEITFAAIELDRKSTRLNSSH